MHNIVVASCLFVVYVNAYDKYAGQKLEPSRPLIEQLNKRWQRSIGQTSFFPGHYYINPIEPSNDLFEHVHVPDSRIDAYIPPYWPFRKPSPVVQDVFPVQNSNPYRSKNPLYAVPIFESDFGSLQQQDHAVPHRLSPEDNYKSYVSSPLSNAYLQPSNKEPNVAIQLLGTTNIFHGFGISPTYQTVADIIRREEDSPMSPDLAESIPKMFKESPTVIIVAMSPEELHSAQESTDTEHVSIQQNEGPVEVALETANGEGSPEMTTNSPSFDDIIDKFNRELNELNLVMNERKVLMEERLGSGVQDEPEYRTEDNTIVFEENSTVENESTFLSMTAGDSLIDELNSTPTEDNSNALPTEEAYQDEITEETETEYETNSVTTESTMDWSEVNQELKLSGMEFLAERIKQHKDFERQQLMTTVDNISAEFPSDSAIEEISVATPSLLETLLKE